MPAGTARTSGSAGEFFSHFNAVRMRVVGQGILKLSMFSLDDINSQNLTSLTLASRSNIQPTVLANFIEQRASLQIQTTSINDYFKINRIIIFSRFHATSIPQ